MVYSICCQTGGRGCCAWAANKVGRKGVSCFALSAHGLQLVMKDLFCHSNLIRLAFRVLERMYNVMKKNPTLVEAVIAAQGSADGQKGLTFKWWGETRWNSKVDALERLIILVPAVNFVLAGQPPQTAGYGGGAVPDVHPVQLPGIWRPKVQTTQSPA